VRDAASLSVSPERKHMAENNWHFELRFTQDQKFHPDGSYSISRSDQMIGNGGRLLVGKTGEAYHMDITEVSYRKLSALWLSDIRVEGVTVARVRRTLNGKIVGEWIPLAAEPAPSSPAVTAPPQASEGGTGIAQALSGDAMAGALKWAGTLVNQSTGAGPLQLAGTLINRSTGASALQLAGKLLSRSSGSGWQALGSLLSSVSREIGQSPGPETLAGDVSPKRLPGYQPGLPSHSAQGASQVDSGPGQYAAPEATARVERAVASYPEPDAIPTTRNCDGCAHFRPYVRISERLTEELGPSLSEETVARAVNELVSQEEKGKGEEARRLADLYKRGKDRWGNRPPSFFSYCAAHERDQREPTVFIAQIRNPDQSCRPVKRADGQRWNDAPTDFTPNARVAHSCSTCAHRIRAAGPGEDAREIREIVSGAINVSGLSMGVGYKGTDAASSLLSSFPEMVRKNGATARAREMAEAFARRGSDSHTAINPRYLDRCGLKSDPGANRYRVCAVENPHDRCPDWTSTKTG
jgi:hypothetical protein